MKCLGRRESDVGHGVAAHGGGDGQQDSLENLRSHDGCQELHDVERRHSVRKAGVVVHAFNLWQDVFPHPLLSEQLGEPPHIIRSSAANRVHVIAEPIEAQHAQFLVEKGSSELLCQKGHALNDGQAHSPLAVLGELDNGRQEGLPEHVHADDGVDSVQVLDNAETNVGNFVPQQQQ